MRLDKPVLRSILPVVFCFFAGLQFAAWRAAFDVLAGRTPGGIWGAFGILLAGCAVGFFVSFALYPSMRRPDKFMLPLSAVAAVMVLVLLGTVGRVELGWQKLLVDYYRSPGALVALSVGTACLFFALPALLVGMVFPMPFFAILHSRRSVPFLPCLALLSVCLLPFAAGIFFAGTFVDASGVENVTRLCLVGYGVTAFVAVLAYGGGAVAKGVGIVACGVFVLACLFVARPVRTATPLLDAHSFARLVYRDSGFAKGTPSFAYRAGGHSVETYEDADYGFVFCQDGRPKIFGNRFFTSRTLAGYLPLALRPGIDRVAVVGGDAGFLVPFLVRGGVSRVDVDGGVPGKLVRAAIAADDAIVRGEATLADSPVFSKIRYGLTKEKPYDLVCLEPEPAWMRGTASLYSKGMFRKARDRVSGEGLVTLHLDVRALSTKRFVAICRDFLHTFPEIQLWNLGLYDWMLVGSKRPFQVQADRAFAFAEERDVRKDLLRAGILSLADLFSCFHCDAEGIRDWLDRAESENAVQSAFRLPELVLGNGPFTLRPNQLESCRRRTLAWLERGTMDEDMFQAIRDKTERNVEVRALVVAAFAEMERGGGKGMEAARDAARMNPRDILLGQFASTLELEGRRRIALGDFKGARKCYERMLLFDAKGALANYGMGYCLRAQGESKAAFQHFVHAVNAAPEQLAYRLELAQVAGQLNDLDEAERQYRVVIKKDPENAEAYFRFAKILCNRERGKPDFDTAVRYAEKACVLTGWKNREYAYGLAEVYLDAGRTLEGMGLKRRLKERHL